MAGKNLLASGTNVLVKIDGVWLPAIIKYPAGDNKHYMMRVYPGYPGAAAGTFHHSESTPWRMPEASVLKFINEFFLDCPSRGLI